jgi:hypothetical protein
MVVHLYEITVPLILQVVALKDKRPIASRTVNFVVEFTSAAPLTAADREQAELALRGKSIAAETELIRCVQTIAATCLAQSKPMIDSLSTLNPHAPKVRAAVVLDGHIRWHKKRPRH